ncbi:MAG: SUF system Fe-S cluster assembly protein [Pseudomonadota bacterium]
MDDTSPKPHEPETATSSVAKPSADTHAATLVDKASSEPDDNAGISDAEIEASPFSRDEVEQISADIVAALKTVYDPEIPTDIYELGLIYRVDLDNDRHVSVDMTLTAPGCPVAGEMPIWVENAVLSVPGVSGCKVTLTFDPPWDMSRMSDEAKLALNMF